MNDSSQTVLSTRQLIVALILSMIVGVGLTIFFILPAETGYDPSGVGELSGLDRLSQSKEERGEAVEVDVPLASADNTLYVSLEPATIKPVVNEFGESQPAMEGTNLRVHSDAYKTEIVEVEIGVDGKVEYKAIMDAGEVLLYSWESDGELYYDFHAHQLEGNPDFWTRYSEGEAKRDQGSIVAPYSGQHGWYWLNLESRPVSVKLRVAGYYEKIIEVELNAEN